MKTWEYMRMVNPRQQDVDKLGALGWRMVGAPTILPVGKLGVPAPFPDGFTEVIWMERERPPAPLEPVPGGGPPRLRVA